MTSSAQSRGNILVVLMSRISKWFLWQCLSISYKFVRQLVHLILTIYYFNRGNAVPPIQNKLLFKSATQLAADIREKRLKSEDVVQAYIARIEEVEPFINATVHLRTTDALREARLVDEFIESGNMSRKQLATEKPLLGVPISVKLNIKIKGCPMTGGSLDSINAIATEDADAIKFMKQAGAIILVSSNAPEKAMGIETDNKLYGRTNNPYNTCRTVGGSSGGEGALLGAGASVLGLGNDTAGSVRIPALYCGVFGHLPSENLVSPHGQLINMGGFTTIGPMCRYAEDLVVAMKVLTMDKGNTIKFDREVDFSKIKLYYINSFGVPFSVPVDSEILQAIRKLLKASNTMFNHKAIAATDIEKVKEILGIPKDINTTKEMLKSVLGLSTYTFNIPFLLKFFNSSLWYDEKNVPHYEILAQQLQKELEELLDNDSVLICPTLPQTVPYHSEVKMIFTDTSYSSLWNMFGFPATHCTLGFNKQGLPLGVQIVSRKNNDSLTLATALELERVFGGWVQPRRK